MVENLNNLLEIRLKNEGDFLKVKETLTRIGIGNSKNRTLYQTAHILHKHGHYYIVHFKQMFELDGKPSNITPEDMCRRTAIAVLLEEWGLIELVHHVEKELYIDIINNLKIIPFKDKKDWKLVEKYKIGKKQF